MEWEPIVAVLIFIGGLAWGRYDGDRRELRASRAAQLAAFDQLQRETHLEVQNHLAETFQAAAQVGFMGAQRGFIAVAARLHYNWRNEMLHLEVLHNSTTVLNSRIADSEVQKLVGDALDGCRELAFAPKNDYKEARERAGAALQAAGVALARLIRKPPSA